MFCGITVELVDFQMQCAQQCDLRIGQLFADHNQEINVAVEVKVASRKRAHGVCTHEVFLQRALYASYELRQNRPEVRVRFAGNVSECLLNATLHDVNTPELPHAVGGSLSRWEEFRLSLGVKTLT